MSNILAIHLPQMGEFLLEERIKFADFYNVSTDYLLGHTPKNSNPKIDTIAAHLAANEYSDEDLQDIKKFIEFVDSKKN